MTATAASAATASAATTTSGLGRSHFKLICCFLPISCPHTKFYPNRTKTYKLKRFTIGQLWLVGTVSQKIAVVISNSFYVVFSTILAPKPNLIKIGWKTQKLKRFAICRLRLVRWVGQKIAVAISNSFYVVLCPMLPTITNFTQIGWKTQKFKFSRFWKHKKDLKNPLKKNYRS